MAPGRHAAYFLYIGRPRKENPRQASRSIGDLQSEGTVLHENDFNTRNERILYIRRSDTGNRPDRALECVYQGGRNHLPQRSAYRNHKTQPPENKSGIAEGSSSHGQGFLCPTHFNLADRSNCLQTESQSRNVFIESEYTVQELRTIYL